MIGPRRAVAPPAPGSAFPDPRLAPPDAPLAAGGDLSPALLLDAYRNGIFPWPEGGVTWWWSPDPRALLPLDGLRVSRSLRKAIRSGGFQITIDRAFAEILRACADRREGTWISRPYQRGMLGLHHRGIAHSVEVWRDGTLVGGLYGVALGGSFEGESMFHRVTDASKVALVALVDRLRERGFTLLDCQLPTAHLASLGVVAVPRGDYLRQLDAALALDVSFADALASET